MMSINLKITEIRNAMTSAFPAYYKIPWPNEPLMLSATRLLLSPRWVPGPWTGPQIGRKVTGRH